jgi:hypothetical protein
VYGVRVRVRHVHTMRRRARASTQSNGHPVRSNPEHGAVPCMPAADAWPTARVYVCWPVSRGAHQAPMYELCMMCIGRRAHHPPAAYGAAKHLSGARPRSTAGQRTGRAVACSGPMY